MKVKGKFTTGIVGNIKASIRALAQNGNPGKRHFLALNNKQTKRVTGSSASIFRFASLANLGVMPGPKWKSHVQAKHAELDECRKRLDALINVAKDGDFEEHTERICKERTANAVVEINIKTRRPSSSASKKHASKEKHEAVSKERRADLASSKESPKSKIRTTSAKSGTVDVVDAATTSKVWKDRIAKEEEASQKLIR